MERLVMDDPSAIKAPDLVLGPAKLPSTNAMSTLPDKKSSIPLLLPL